MKTSENFWIFGHLGLGDHIVCNALYRHYASMHKDKIVIIPIWEHNLSAVQWMLSDVPNIFFYPIETEQQLLMCRDSVDDRCRLDLGFYETECDKSGKWFKENPGVYVQEGHFPVTKTFNPVKWDSEFYRQAGLDPELKWKGFKLPDIDKETKWHDTTIAIHQDKDRGFVIREEFIPQYSWQLGNGFPLKDSCRHIYFATEIHCIDSSMLNLADLIETPYCKRFVFHRYARKGLPPKLKKNWEIID